MVDENKPVVLNLGEWWAGNHRETVVAMHGLGSCIGVTLYDPRSGAGAAAHIVLPNARAGQAEENPAKFADTSLPFLIAQLKTFDGARSRLVLKIVGGANVLRFPRADDVLSIGTRNIEVFRQAAKECRLTIQAADVGGNHGRSMRFYLEDGRITVASFGKENMVL